MRAALYYRYSITDKPEEVPGHLNQLRQYAKERAWSVQDYCDSGIMGKKDNRPAFHRLLRDAKARQFDVILCYSLSRWASSLPQLINSLADVKRLGIEFVSLNDNISLDAIGIIQDFLKTLNREKIRQGMIQSRALGIQCGRKATDTQKIARVIEVYLQDERQSVRDIGKKVGLPKSTVFRTLQQYRDGQINEQGLPVRAA